MTIKKVRRGESLLPALTAEWYNATVPAEAGGPPSAVEGDAGDFYGVRVKVRNDTGAALDRFSVVGLGAPLFSTDDGSSLQYFKNKPALAGEVPVDPTHVNRFAVLLQSVSSEAIGDALLIGVVPAQVDVEDTEHEWADIADGETEHLASTARGSAFILSTIEQTGLQWCLVELGHRPHCLPEQLIRDIRVTDTQMIKDVWFTDRPCDEYVPYVVATFTDCYVPDSPYAPASTLHYFDDDFVLEEHTEWSISEDWQFGPPGVDDDMSLLYPGGGDPSPAVLTVTIGEDGGFVQLRFTTGGTMGAVISIDGDEVIDGVSSGAGEWITVGPYALDAGTHTISLDVDGSSGTCQFDGITVWGVE